MSITISNIGRDVKIGRDVATGNITTNNNIRPDGELPEVGGVENMPALIQLVLECGNINSPQDLWAIFADDRLKRWQSKLPTGGSLEDIISQCLAVLGNEGRISFFQVLREKTDRDDRCWGRLGL